MKRAYFVSSSVACGKSTFLKIAEQMGHETLSADEINARLLREFAGEIKGLLSEFYFCENEGLDRALLRKIIFQNEEARRRLEGFLHPKIREEILTQMKILDGKKQIYFVEIPLFFETGSYEGLGPVVVIYSSEEKIIQRLIKNRGLDEEEARRILRAQLSIEEKKKRADFVIENRESLEDFKKNCEDFLRNLRRVKNENL